MPKSNVFVLAAILALVLSFTLFGNGIGGDFVFDDTIVIMGNPFIDGQLDGFWKIFTNPYFAYQPRPGLYRPLTIASYSLNAFIFGTSSAGFHVVNIVLHAIVSFLIFVFINRLAGKAAALVGFLFFMFLPIHVEAVTSIVGRAEILSLLFVVGALLVSLKKKYILASGLFFLGLLSKEVAVAFLPIFLFLEFFWHKNDIRSVVRGSLFFIPPVVIYAILRYAALGEYFLENDATLVYNPIKFAPFLSGLWTSFKVFYLYIEKMFYPLSFSIDYSFNQVSLVGNPFSSVEAVLGIVILGLAILLFFKTKDFMLRLGIVTFLSSYFVISNWIFKTGTIMAERLMYMPSLGLVMLLASILNFKFSIFNQNSRSKILNSLTIYYLLLSTLFVWYGYLIIDRNRDWLNSRNLYESAYAETPNSVVNKTNKAYLDFIAGDYGKAESRLNEILKEAPDHIPTLNLAGQNYKKLGQYQKAEELWKKAIKLRSDYLRAYLSLGVLYYGNGYFKSAEKVLTEAVNIYPRWSEVLFLALTQVSLDKPDEAIELINRHFDEKAFRKELKFALGWAYLNKGQREKAFSYFNQVKDPKITTEDFVKTFEGSKVIILGDY